MTSLATASSWATGTWYEATAQQRKARPALAGTEHCDVVVVGGGYTGLAAALELAERGFAVVLLEAARIGDGASGRNGGQILTGYNLPMTAIARLVGRDDASLLWALAREAKAMIRDRVDRHDIACDLTPGHLLAALTPRHQQALHTELAEWQDTYGYTDARLVGRDEVRSLVDCPLYVGGLYDAGGGHLHPLNYAFGLAAAAEQAGARLCEGSPVERLEAGPGGVLAGTSQGEIRAGFAVLTGDPGVGPGIALSGRIGTTALARQTEATAAKDLAAYVVSVESRIIATEPLGPTAAAVIPSNAALCDAKLGVTYYRRTPDDRIMFGGGSTLLGRSVKPPPTLVREMRRTLPALAPARIAYAWSGTVGITPSQIPRFGRLSPDILFAHGFSGQGVALAGLAGRLIAEALAGTAERFDVFARIPHRRFPGGPWLRLPALVLARAWQRLRDRL